MKTKRRGWRPKGNISFVSHGGGQEIGASLYLLNVYGHQIQFESGVRPRVLWTPETYHDALPRVLNEDIDTLREVRDLVITHPHLDHIGALIIQLKRMSPKTLRNLRVWMTQPTWFFSELQLNQTVVSMNGRDPSWVGREPLFTFRDIEELKKYVRIVEFGEIIELNASLSMIPFPAGHILGAASFLLIQKIPGGEVRIVMTGDTSDQDQFFIKGRTQLALPVDFLCSEGTNLGKNQDLLEKPIENVIEGEGVLGTLNRGGIVLFSALSIHREPDLIARCKTAGLNKIADFYIDGGREALTIFKACLLPEQREILEDLRFITGGCRERENVLRERGAVVIAAGGMFPERSPANWWLRRLVEHDDASIVISNWQDPCSPGSALLAHRHRDDGEHAHKGEHEGEREEAPPTILIGGEEHRVRCQIHRLTMSSHQEEGEFEAMREGLSPRMTVLFHADYTQAMRYMKEHGTNDFVYPHHRKEVTL